MTELELVQDTINYYREHPRAANEEDHCQYKTNDGKMCAVGRFINWDKVEDVKYVNEKFGSISNLDLWIYEELQGLLLDEVVAVDREVWEDLQGYHDYTLTKSPNSIKEQEGKLIEKYSKLNNKICQKQL